jgi:hypothetical protein
MYPRRVDLGVRHAMRRVTGPLEEYRVRFVEILLVQEKKMELPRHL